MGNMVQRAKSILRTNEFTVLYDKGFHTGSELKTAQDIGVETIVAIPGVPSTSQAPDHANNYEHFKYNREEDAYTCPAGEVLHTNGSWYKQLSSSGSISRFKQYKTKACRKCPKKGIARADSDVGFMFIAYYLRRIANILTMNRLKEYLRMLSSLFQPISDIMGAIFEMFKGLKPGTLKRLSCENRQWLRVT